MHTLRLARLLAPVTIAAALLVACGDDARTADAPASSAPAASSSAPSTIPSTTA